MKIKLKESNEVTTDLEKIIRDATSNGKFPDTISYKGKTYKEFQVMDFDRPEVSQVYYCNMENTPSGDPQESNDYFFVSATLNKVPNGYKGVKEINFVEDLTESEDEVPKITAFSIAQFEAERLGGTPLNIDENHSAVEFKFRGKVYNIDIRLKELGDSIQETDGTQVDDIEKKEEYPQFKLGKRITNLVETNYLKKYYNKLEKMSDKALYKAWLEVKDAPDEDIVYDKFGTPLEYNPTLASDALFEIEGELARRGFMDDNSNKTEKWKELTEDEVINNLEPEEKQDLVNLYNDRTIKGYKCIGCNKIINNITDFKKKAFKDRNGYYCPYCGEPYSFEGLQVIELKESYTSSGQVIPKIQACIEYNSINRKFRSLGSSMFLPFVYWIQQETDIATGIEELPHFYDFIARVTDKAMENKDYNANSIYNTIKHILEVWEHSSDKENITADELIKIL